MAAGKQQLWMQNTSDGRHALTWCMHLALGLTMNLPSPLLHCIAKMRDQAGRCLASLSPALSGAGTSPPS